MDDDDHHNLPPPKTEEIREKMISSFTTEITSSSRDAAIHFLEAHQWNINAAVSAFNEAVVSDAAAAARPNVPDPARTQSSNPVRVDIPAASSPPSPTIRLRSPRSPPSSARNPFSREAIQQDDDDKENDDAMESDDVARDVPSSSSLPRRLILSDVTPQVLFMRTITIWRNSVTVRDVENTKYAQFLQERESLDSPRVQDSPGGTPRAVTKFIWRQQEDHFPQHSPKPFQGVGRTLAEQNSVPPASSDSLTTQPTPSIDPTAPTTTIKIILADGTLIVSRFNTNLHTVRDVRRFIDAATPDAAASRDYHLLIMGRGSPPTPLTTDLDQTIDQAGISNSVLTQKF